MKDIQATFNTIQEKKQELKKLRSVYKDVLAQSDQYEAINEKLQELREVKKSIEQAAQDEMGGDWARFEQLKENIKSDQEMISDIAMTKIMQGEGVVLKDVEDNEYEPVFSVRFKKV